MPLPPDYLASIGGARSPSWGPLVVPWPMPGDLGGMVTFSTFAEWRDFVVEFGLRQGAPAIVATKFERAQKLYILAWLDFDLIKAGELVALTALEGALMDRYGYKVKREQKRALLTDQLMHMINVEGLDESKVPMNLRCGPPSKVLPFITGAVTPGLADIRNGLAHGAPLDGFPRSGLLELVRDLIDYVYRAFLYLT